MDFGDACVGDRVRVADNVAYQELRGKAGRIVSGWGPASSTVFHVVLEDDGRSELFWFFQLKEQVGTAEGVYSKGLGRR